MHSSQSIFVTLDTDVGPGGLAGSLCSNTSQRLSVWLRSGLYAGPSGCSTPNSLIPLFMNLALCTGVQSCWNRKWWSNTFGSVKLSKMPWCAETLELPFIGTKTPSPSSELQIIIPPCTKLHTWHTDCQSDKFHFSNCQSQTCRSHTRHRRLVKIFQILQRIRVCHSQLCHALHHCIRCHNWCKAWMQLLGPGNPFHDILCTLFLLPQLGTSVYSTPQHPVTLLCDFTWPTRCRIM